MHFFTSTRTIFNITFLTNLLCRPFWKEHPGYSREHFSRWLLRLIFRSPKWLVFNEELIYALKLVAWKGYMLCMYLSFQQAYSMSSWYHLSAQWYTFIKYPSGVNNTIFCSENYLSHNRNLRHQTKTIKIKAISKEYSFRLFVFH